MGEMTTEAYMKAFGGRRNHTLAFALYRLVGTDKDDVLSFWYRISPILTPHLKPITRFDSIEAKCINCEKTWREHHVGGECP